MERATCTVDLVVSSPRKCVVLLKTFCFPASIHAWAVGTCAQPLSHWPALGSTRFDCLQRQTPGVPLHTALVHRRGGVRLMAPRSTGLLPPLPASSHSLQTQLYWGEPRLAPTGLQTAPRGLDSRHRWPPLQLGRPMVATRVWPADLRSPRTGARRARVDTARNRRGAPRQRGAAPW